MRVPEPDEALLERAKEAALRRVEADAERVADELKPVLLHVAETLLCGDRVIREGQEAVADVFRLAAIETLERLRQDWEPLPAVFAPLLLVIEKHIFSHGFGASTARRLAGVGRLELPLGKPLSAYLDELRVCTATRMLELAGGRIPSGRIAAAVGFATYQTWCRALLRCTGEVPRLVRLPAALSLELDNLTWHRASRAELSPTDARALLRRLGRLYPAAADLAEPSAQLLATAGSRPIPEVRYGGISEAEAGRALERAARVPLRRLHHAAEGLPQDPARVLADTAANLFDPALSVESCRRRTGVRDTGISTKILFFIGDTVADVIEKRRIETAVHLLGDRRFTIERISEAVGLSYRRFVRIFKKRCGAQPSQVRKTLLASCGHPAYALWCRAESGELSATEAAALAAHLRALCPPAGDDRETLAVRADVDPRRVGEIVSLVGSVQRRERPTLDGVLRTHPDYAAAHWYVHWIRDRLGRASLYSAWEDWQTADRTLCRLLQSSRERRAEIARWDRACQTDAFLYLLVDCAFVRLFHDAAESEHYADLAVAASGARRSWDQGPEAVDLRALALGLKGNALKRRNELAEASREFEKAFSLIRSHDGTPWVEGRVCSLYASVLDRQGRGAEAQRYLFRSSTWMKRSGDTLERLRAVIKRASYWYSRGKNPSRLLGLCISVLRQLPFAHDLLQSAHLNRLEATLYLGDRLTGRTLGAIESLRAEMPKPSSRYIETHYQQLDGVILTLAGRPEAGSAALHRAASWYEENEVAGDAVICWLQYSWAVLELDSGAACRAASRAFQHMQSTGFRGHGAQEIAEAIHRAARRRTLERELLRRGILRAVCPDARPDTPPGRTPAV